MIQYFFSGFYKIVRTFLECNSAQKGNYFFSYTPVAITGAYFRGLNRIIYGSNLIQWYVISLVHNRASQVAYCDHPIGSKHTFPFNIKYLLIYMLPAAVKFGGMHVHD